MTDDNITPPPEPIQPIALHDEMENSFLEYAMSVIMSRALPDVRDGLKPVHRRIIWDMEEQGFRPDRGHVKCARVSGDTMARFHPHGDGAIYDALVRMAQPFSLRHPLIDFHGNYGSPDFGPAASRYTECRLHPLAMQLLADIDEETVDMIPNYDGTTEEPVVLPARFPNLLVNGSQGIAVGMATNIPPHNLGEVIDAVLHLIDNPEATPDDLMQFVKGPDFPTGASILGRAGIIDAYRTGRGSVKMRATVSIEESRTGRLEILVSEIPYQTSCSAIASRIQELVDSGNLDGIADVNDASSGGKTNLIITLKRDANANVVKNNLFKLTQLQSTFSINMVALVDGVPRQINLRDALVAYVRHQVDVITRRSQFRLDKAKPPRAHPRGPYQGARRHRPDHRPHPVERRRRGRPRRADGRAVRVQRDPGERHPRHAVAPADAAVAHRPADRTRRRAGRHHRPAGDPRQPGAPEQRDPRRDHGHP